MSEWIRERVVNPFVQQSRQQSAGRHAGRTVQGTIVGIKRTKRVGEAKSRAKYSSLQQCHQPSQRGSCSKLKQPTLGQHFVNRPLPQPPALPAGEKEDDEMASTTLFESHTDGHSSAFDTTGPASLTNRSPVSASTRKRKGIDEQSLVGGERTPSKRVRISSRRSDDERPASGPDFDEPPGARLIVMSQSKARRKLQKSSSGSARLISDDETQTLDWDGDSVAASTPPQKRMLRIKCRSTAFAPAISPSKRRALIEQSAKDTAMQQHRRSKGPLTSIDNLSASNSLEVRSSSQSSGREKTPSPLRKGFSLIHLDQSLDASNSNTDDDIEDFEGPPSPLSERSVHCSRRMAGAIALSPISKRRIYAFETQHQDADAGGDTSDTTVRAAGFNSDCVERASSYTSIGDGQQSGTSDQKFFRARHGRDQPNDASSSQTAPGGSWSADDGREFVEPVVALDVERKQGTLEGWGLSKDTSVKSMVNAELLDGNVRESGMYAQDKHVSSGNTTLDMFTGPTPTLRDDETQPLPWELESMEAADSLEQLDVEHDAQHTVLHQATQRQIGHPRSQWEVLDKVWSGHLGDGEAKTTPTRTSRLQSSLDRFGFTRTAEGDDRRGTVRGTSPMSEAEDVPSDADEEVDTGAAREFEPRRSISQALRLRFDDAFERESQLSETQPLPWDDCVEKAPCVSPDDVQWPSQEMALSIPSDSDLDSQVRQFFDVL